MYNRDFVSVLAQTCSACWENIYIYFFYDGAVCIAHMSFLKCDCGWSSPCPGSSGNSDSHVVLPLPPLLLRLLDLLHAAPDKQSVGQSAIPRAKGVMTRSGWHCEVTGFTVNSWRAPAAAANAAAARCNSEPLFSSSKALQLHPLMFLETL